LILPLGAYFALTCWYRTYVYEEIASPDITFYFRVHYIKPIPVLSILRLTDFKKCVFVPVVPGIITNLNKEDYMYMLTNFANFPES
jgi:hypothetical protein